MTLVIVSSKGGYCACFPRKCYFRTPYASRSHLRHAKTASNSDFNLDLCEYDANDCKVTITAGTWMCLLSNFLRCRWN